MSDSLDQENVLFGMLAVLMGFVEHDDVVDALEDHTQDGVSRLGDILVARDKLSRSQRELLQKAAAEQLAKHRGNVGASLAAVSSIQSGQDVLRQLTDSGNQITISYTGSPTPDAGSVDSAYVMGSPTNERFTKLRFHAQGGIGEISEARDEQLNRVVALKELQSEFAVNADYRNRFVMEGEVTGSLEHPGIVPIYSMGCNKHGNPFYVMRFIEGETLRDAIHRFHDTAKGSFAYSRHSLPFRELLRRFIDVCNAVQYAHSRGVIHRDIKPANVMLGRYGETLLVDWGAARIVGRGEKAVSDSNERTLYPKALQLHEKTTMGSKIGTPAYMSPEQAEGNIDKIGLASDMYSLGATLYYLLTNKTAFAADTMSEYLRSVRKGQFPMPSEVNSKIPKPLEAICLKAMNLEPAERYASPRAMAIDIERWLATDRVSVYKENIFELLGRWARRHRSWAIAGVATVCIAAVVASIAAALINGARQKEAMARSEAVERFAQTRETVDKWLTGFSEAVVFYPGVQTFRERMLEQAAQDYEEFAEQQSSDVLLELERGRTYVRLGDVRRSLMQHSAATKAYQKAEQIFATIEEIGFNDHSLVEIAQTQVRQAIVAAELGEHQNAKEFYLSAVQDLRDLVSLEPDNEQGHRSLVNALTLSGSFLVTTSQLTEAEGLIQEAMTRQLEKTQAAPGNLELLIPLAETRLAFGELLLQINQFQRAKAVIEEAISNWDRLLQRAPDVPQHLISRAEARIHLATASLKLGHYDIGNAAYRRALEDYKVLEKSMPDVPQYRENSALTQTDLGQLLFELGRPAEAVAEFTKALGVFNNLAAKYPQVDRLHEERAVCVDNLGEALIDVGRFSDALAAHAEAERIFGQLVIKSPESARYIERHATSKSHLAHTLHRLEETEKALPVFQSTLELLQSAIELNPDVDHQRQTLAIVWQRYGDALLDANKSNESREAYGSAQMVWKELLQRAPAADHFHRAALFHVLCPAEGGRDAHAAVTQMETALKTAPDNPLYKGTLAAAYYRVRKYEDARRLAAAVVEQGDGHLGRDFLFLCMAEHQLGSTEQARQHCLRAVTWIKDHRPGNADLQRIQREATQLLGFEQPNDIVPLDSDRPLKNPE